MLGSYMEDIGITAKEFEAACTQGKSITGKFHQQLFEQVSIYRIADSDYLLCILKSSHLLVCRSRVLDFVILKVAILGLGGGRLRDFQEDDDSEEH